MCLFLSCVRLNLMSQTGHGKGLSEDEDVGAFAGGAAEATFGRNTEAAPDGWT